VSPSSEELCDVADGSVEVVEVMLVVVESHFVNKAKGFAAAKATAKTRAKMVERRILLFFCVRISGGCTSIEEQRRMRVSKTTLIGGGVAVEQFESCMEFYIYLGYRRTRKISANRLMQRFCVTLLLSSD
jgi:hypothetical protein